MKRRVPDEQLSPISRHLRAMREEVGLTVREIADECGMPYTTYHYYESPKFADREIRKAARDKIAAVLLARGIEPRRVSALGGLPEASDGTAAALEDLSRRVNDLTELITGVRRTG